MKKYFNMEHDILNCSCSSKDKTVNIRELCKICRDKLLELNPQLKNKFKEWTKLDS